MKVHRALDLLGTVPKTRGEEAETGEFGLMSPWVNEGFGLEIAYAGTSAVAHPNCWGMMPPLEPGWMGSQRML